MQDRFETRFYVTITPGLSAIIARAKVSEAHTPPVVTIGVHSLHHDGNDYYFGIWAWCDAEPPFLKHYPYHRVDLLDHESPTLPAVYSDKTLEGATRKLRTAQDRHRAARVGR